MGTNNNSRIAKILTKANVARAISDNLLGECHPIKHRMWVGGFLMATGVVISKVLSTTYFHFIFEGIGYLIHGAGTIPFIDWFGKERVTPKLTNDSPKVLEVSDVEANT